MATTPSYLSLTTNKLIKPTNSLSYTDSPDSWCVCPGHRAWTLSGYKQVKKYKQQ